MPKTFNSCSFQDSAIGQFPSDWNIVPLSKIVRKIKRGPSLAVNTDGVGIRYLTSDNISESGAIDWTIEKHLDIKPELLDSLLVPEDLILNCVNSAAQIGKVSFIDFLPEVTTVGFNNFALSTNKDMGFSKFLFYLLNHNLFQSQISKTVKPAINQVSFSATDIANLLLPLPPTINEQKCIAEILDTIDSTIAHTSTLIAKLKQMKAGLLHDLLTRGLDENGKLRDAIEHPEQFKGSPLGQIPKDWKVMSLHSACLDVVDCPHTTPVFRNEGVLVARTSNIRDGSFDERNASKVSQEEYYQRISRLEPMPGDVIFTREAPVGEAFVISSGMKICLGQRTMLLRPNLENITSEYVIAQIYSGAVRTRIQQLVGGTTNPHLNVAEVRDFTLPVPPVKEQLLMTATLNTYTQRINAEELYLTKLKEQKKGLMHDLLTGRVRVTDLKEIPA